MKYFLTLTIIVAVFSNLFSDPILKAPVPLEELIPQPKIAIKYSNQQYINDRQLGKNSISKLAISTDTTGKPERVKTALYLQSILRNEANYSFQPFNIIPMDTVTKYYRSLVILLDESEIYKIKPIADIIYKNIGTRTNEQLNNSWYSIEISDSIFAIIGKDEEGLRAAINTIKQLKGDWEQIAKVRIMDWADYKYRWVFSQHNLRGANSITDLTKIADTMAFYNLNGIQQGDYKYANIPQQPNYYFDSVARFKDLCEKRFIDIIPSVCGLGWSSGILWNDPNLAEGLKTVVNYVVEADSARLLPVPAVAIPNGGFEVWQGYNIFGKNSWHDDQFDSQDFTEKHSGNASVKCSNFDGTNSRFCKELVVQNNRAYLLTAWVKTKNFEYDSKQGGVNLLAIGKNKAGKEKTLTFTALSIPTTSNGWIKVEVAFNTLNFDTVNVYAGVWGAKSGTIWWDDFSIKDYGLTNILRRNGTPLIVKDANKKNNIAYKEGIDFANVVDPILQNGWGDYGPYHQAPKFRILPNSKIKNGDTITISSYHPFAAVSDNDGNGSVMVCVNEPKTDTIIRRQIFDMKKLYEPKNYFMGHDEIRNMNWDDACLKDNTDPKDMPAQQLSMNINKCVASIKEANPNANTFMWSDMVDSTHNAHKDYYLINGDLTGVWNKIPNDKITIVNWNGGKAKESLNFFANKNFSQITSPYYDSGNTDNIRDWRIAQEGVPGVQGMMYTSWQNDFRFLTPFAYYAWGAGTNFIHKHPTEKEILDSNGLNLYVQTLTDPYDKTAKTDSVWVEVVYGFINAQNTEYYPMKKVANNQYSLRIIMNELSGAFTYKIYAKNSQGITSSTIRYKYNLSQSSIDTEKDTDLGLDLKLNNKTMEIISSSEIQNVSIVDLNGKYLLEQNINSNSFNFEFQTAGTYLVKIGRNNNFTTKKVIVR